MSKIQRGWRQQLEQIRKGPQGPKVCAFFDMDGTVVAGFTVSHVAIKKLKDREVSLGGLFEALGTSLELAAGDANFEDFLRLIGERLQGQTHQELLDAGYELFEKTIRGLIYPEMRRLIRAHQQAGHTVVLASSASVYQVLPVAEFLGISHTICNRFEIVDGQLSGELTHPIVWGKTKASSAREFAEQHKYDLQQAHFYADGGEDTALMHLVGNPRPTNPRSKMQRIAKQRGWPCMEFKSRKANSHTNNLAGIASLFPIGTTGAWLGSLTGDKRTSLNFASPLWLRTLFLYNKVKFSVIGKKFLKQQRPAVFIYNHRNNFDPLITAMLVEKNYTIVSHENYRDHWFFGSLGKLLDMAFLEHDKAGTSKATLKRSEDIVNRGLSLIISPEQSKQDTCEVGEFHRLAFEVALHNQLPIIPIVFLNADWLAAKDSAVINPGTVEVKVLDPIAISDWTEDNLAEKIDNIRQRYVDTLRASDYNN